VQGNFDSLFDSPDDGGPLPPIDAIISPDGGMPPLPGLPPLDFIRSMSDEQLIRLNSNIAEMARNYRMLRQRDDFEVAVGQLMVLGRLWMVRQGDNQGVLH
jgi:hypothetical protein